MSKLVPYPFQREAIEAICSAPGFILADVCGLGKTLSVTEAVKASRPDSGFRALVIVPPTLMEQWYRHLMSQDDRPVLVSQGLPYKFDEMEGWVITSLYNLRKGIYQSALESVLWDFVIVDEAHRMKNPKTQFFESVKHLNWVKGISMTGTPIETSPKDLWTLLHLANPDRFPAYWGFVMQHLEVTHGYFEKNIIGGPKDPTAFAEMIAPYFMRRTKEDVLPDLPEKILIEEPVVMEDKQRKLYDQILLSDDIIASIDWNDELSEMVIKNVLAHLTKLQQAASHPMLLGLDADIKDSGKIRWLSEFIEDHPDEPTVIFSRFKDWLRPLCREFDGVLVAGNQDWSGYFTEGNVNYLFGTIDKMGEGLNLQKAHHAIFLDGHWSSRAMNQAIDRVHRMDIKESKNIYFLTSCREDAMIYEAVEKKWTEQEFIYYYLQEARDTYQD